MSNIPRIGDSNQVPPIKPAERAKSIVMRASRDNGASTLASLKSEKKVSVLTTIINFFKRLFGIKTVVVEDSATLVKNMQNEVLSRLAEEAAEACNDLIATLDDADGVISNLENAQASEIVSTSPQVIVDEAARRDFRKNTFSNEVKALVALHKDELPETVKRIESEVELNKEKINKEFAEKNSFIDGQLKLRSTFINTYTKQTDQVNQIINRNKTKIAELENELIEPENNIKTQTDLKNKSISDRDQDYQGMSAESKAQLENYVKEIQFLTKKVKDAKAGRTLPFIRIGYEKDLKALEDEYSKANSIIEKYNRTIAAAEEIITNQSEVCDSIKQQIKKLETDNIYYETAEGTNPITGSNQLRSIVTLNKLIGEENATVSMLEVDYKNNESRKKTKLDSEDLKLYNYKQALAYFDEFGIDVDFQISAE
ncbi:MAG: hypothetical protein JHC93_04980 [Parachlamydiales bacterium]|nr:hypothetical protein [Parachlamydiales bacterium]